jgi:hypothetical protein
MKCASAIMIFGLAAAQARAQSHLEEALNVYSELTGRTLLRASGLSDMSASIISKEEALADKNRALSLIVSELAKRRIQIVPDGEAFARVLDSSWSNAPAAACLARIPPPPAHPQARPADSSQQIPPGGGVINFDGADLKQVLDIYSMLRQRTILQPPSLPSVPIKLVTEAPLTKEETVYAMNVVMALNGIAAVDDGEHFVQVVAAQQLSLVKPNAPKPPTDAPRLDPAQLSPPQEHGLLVPRQGVQRPETEAPMRINLPPTMDSLLEVYARLTGQKAVSSLQYGAARVSFEIATPLTKEEALYAIETVLRLNGVEIVPVGEKAIQLGTFWKRSKDKSKPAETFEAK